MAVGFNASGDHLVRTTNLPSITSFTMMGWFRIDVDLNDYTTFMKFGVVNTFENYLIDTTANGTTLQLYNADITGTGSSLVVGDWNHLAMTVSGVGANQFQGFLNGLLNISISGNSAPAAQQMIIGDNYTTGFQRLNGSAAAIKVYSAVLSEAEISLESKFYLPVRTTSLNGLAFLRDVSEAATDYSGLGNNWTIGGTLTTENGPPIAWAPEMDGWAAAAAGHPAIRRFGGIPYGPRRAMRGVY